MTDNVNKQHREAGCGVNLWWACLASTLLSTGTLAYLYYDNATMALLWAAFSGLGCVMFSIGGFLCVMLVVLMLAFVAGLAGVKDVE